MRIEEFNRMSAREAAERLRVCADIPAWVDGVIGGRPYEDAAAVYGAAAALAQEWTPDDVARALADHPRIGEAPAEGGAAADRSRTEQGGVDPGEAGLMTRLREGNARYEATFGRIYLVRAKGRTGEEMATLLEQRLRNDPTTEDEVTRTELAQIALLRLMEVVS